MIRQNRMMIRLNRMMKGLPPVRTRAREAVRSTLYRRGVSWFEMDLLVYLFGITVKKSSYGLMGQVEVLRETWERHIWIQVARFSISRMCSRSSMQVGQSKFYFARLAWRTRVSSLDSSCQIELPLSEYLAIKIRMYIIGRWFSSSALPIVSFTKWVRF
jgi:hypothetical protein